MINLFEIIVHANTLLYPYRCCEGISLLQALWYRVLKHCWFGLLAAQVQTQTSPQQVNH